MLSPSCNGSFILSRLCLGQGLPSRRTGVCVPITLPGVLPLPCAGGPPSLVGCISFIHSWVCSLPLHSMVSQSISSAPGLHQEQGCSDRPSLISGHSHGDEKALGHRGHIKEVSTESQQVDQQGHKMKLWFTRFLFLQLVKTTELDPSWNYLAGFHPHGNGVIGAFTNLCTECMGFSSVFPGICSHLMMLNMWFWFPFFRDYAMSMGESSYSRYPRNCEG